MVEGHVGHPLSAVPDQGLKAYPLRDMPELPSGRRTATQDHPTIWGQYRYRRSQAAEAAVLTKMFQGTSHSRSFCLQRINASRTSSCCTRRQCTLRRRTDTHTWVGRRELVRESWTGTASGNKKAGVVQTSQTKHPFVLFARSLQLLAESTCSKHNVFTSFVRLRANKSTGKVLSLHASQSQIILATFKRNTTSHSLKQL
jgi:hypothetical protein